MPPTGVGTCANSSKCLGHQLCLVVFVERSIINKAWLKHFHSRFHLSGIALNSVKAKNHKSAVRGEIQNWDFNQSGSKQGSQVSHILMGVCGLMQEKKYN